MARQSSFKNFSDDDCTLLCPDNSLDSPIEGSHGRRNVYFRRRQSQPQIPRMSRLESSISIQSLSANTPHLEERMRRRLKYFFMNPCQKYQAKRRKPFKLALQIIKIALVTAQLCLFGEFNLSIVNFKLRNDEVFKSAFLDHNTSYYTKAAVYTQVNNIRKEYALWKNNTIGIFDYPPIASDNSSIQNHAPPVQMCVTSYDLMDGTTKGNDSILNFDLNAESTFCYKLKIWAELTRPLSDHSTPLQNGSNYEFDFARLNSIDITLGFIVVQINTPKGFTAPTCFNTIIAITFDNSEHNGAMMPSLRSEYHMIACNDEEPRETINGMKVFLNVFDSVIMLTCMFSMLLCLTSLWKAQRLRKKFEIFFLAQYNKKISFSEQMEFFNLWYLLIIISDVLTVLGSLLKMVLQNKYLGIVDYNICSMFLGVGCLCVWIGVLRYAGFFHKYNILVLTLKKALPHVCRFMVCASVLYFGFMFCGWAVLGPHHHKFRSLVVTSEALFSLLNGDDMYMTYEEMSRQYPAMVVFSQVYLYVFISLFIYVVLSLFIAVIMDTYETIKEYQDRTEPEQNEIEKFMAPCTADASVENYWFELNSPTRCCCCCFGPDEDFTTDDEQLES